MMLIFGRKITTKNLSGFLMKCEKKAAAMPLCGTSDGKNRKKAEKYAAPNRISGRRGDAFIALPFSQTDPGAAMPRLFKSFYTKKREHLFRCPQSLVDVIGLEPMTFRTSSERSSQLS